MNKSSIKSRGVIQQQGATLIELIIFITLIALLASAVFVPIDQVLLHSPKAMGQLKALTIARSRMELLLGERYHQGFANFTAGSDPCQAPVACVPSGYLVNVTVQDGWSQQPSNNHFKTVIVQVSGKGAATLTTLVAE